MAAIGGHHRAYEGATNTWLTPPSIVESLGPFSLDPCGYPNWKTADKLICEPEDGLSADWSGHRVWLNPPYGPHTGKWLEKLAKHGIGTALIFARTETAMFFDHVWRSASALLFLEGRLHFHYPNGERAKHNSGAPSVLVAYGVEDSEALYESNLDGKYIAL